MGHFSDNSIQSPSRKAFLRVWAFLLSVAAVLSLLSPGLPTEAANTAVSKKPSLRITVDGVETRDIYMTTTERVELSAQDAPEGASFQWQILHPESENSWISIYDGIRQELSVTMALAKNMLRADGTVQLRCRATENGEAVYSDPVTVHIAQPQPVRTTLLTQEAAKLDTVSGAEGDEIPEFVTITINYLRYDYKWEDGKLVVDINGNYVLEEVGQAFLPYIATLHGGNSIDTVVANPTMVGYDAYLRDPDSGNVTPANSVTLDFDSVTTNITYYVEYRPSLVDYAVRYFEQNVYDDLYVEDTTMYFQGQAHTGTTPPMDILNKDNPGFTPLYYQPDYVAADGSTVFEVYYERDYYLMEFDCDGGYGTETLYIRYGSYISVPQPVKPGWIFNGWDRVYYEEEVEEEVDGEIVKKTKRINEANGTADTLPETMPNYNSGYKALWRTTDTTYTVVYWRENADDNGYSYWGSTQMNAQSNTYVSGTDNVPNSVSTSVVDGQNLNEKPYFTYNDALTDKNVLVEGDGSTVVNVYYTRNVYHIYFRGISGTCAITEHTHGTNCNKRLICMTANHMHTDECLECTIEEHIHTASCCTRVEHIHAETCCSLTAHSHNSNCCTLNQHTHGTSCYTGVGNRSNYQNAIGGQKVEGNVYRGLLGTYIYINGVWYNYSGTANSGTIAPTTCNSIAHTHGTGCNSGKCAVGYEHTHNTGNCNGQNCSIGYVHTHGDGTCVCANGKQEHTHSKDCYKCEFETSHTHTDSCYSACTLLEHTHSNTCRNNSTNNVIRVISAKYEQTIGDIWPTAADFTNITLYGWDIDNVDSTAVSKRVTMTKDLCDTSDRLKYADAETGGTRKYLYYMFESFDQSSPANGNERILRNGIYYDRSPLYSQEVNSSSGSFNQKEITGMAPVSNGVTTSGNNIFLYYNRNRQTLKFHNYNAELTDHQATVLYGAPLAQYEIKEEDVPYPSTLEPNAYEFGGWFTTPQCFDGTDVKWNTITMPNSDLTLYAKWTPILRNVTFYEFYDQIGTDAAPFQKAENVPHGELLGSTYNRIPEAREGYRFIGWFYMDEDNKKRFAPDSMEVTRDLVLFAEWTTTIDTTYQVDYVLQEDVPLPDPNDPTKTIIYPAGTVIADEEFNHITVGKTKTFQAKGGTQLYPLFRQNIFPTVSSHSILMKENGSENTFTFEYIYDEEVYYKVRYLDYQTRTELASTIIKKTEKAVVTEKFKPIQNYMPTSFYVTRALVSDGDGTGTDIPDENVLTFYYIKDEEHGMFSIEHYLENADSTDTNNPDNYTLYESEVGTADTGTKKTGEPKTYKGFAHYEALDTVVTYEVIGTDAEGNPIYKTLTGTLTGTVTYLGLTIKIYYDRQQYPYIIEYREHGADEDAKPLKRLDANGNPIPENGNLPLAKYDSEVVHTAVSDFTLDGINYEYYIPDSTAEQRTKSTVIREVSESDPNKLIFYYVQKKIPVHYHAVCTEETSVKFGAVSMASESAATAAGLGGSTATPASGFVFEGWFHDEACTDPVNADWVDTAKGNLLKPKEFTLEDGTDEDHYYALFSPVKRDLKIKKEGVTSTTDSFLFSVAGTNALGQNVELTVCIQGSGEVLIRDLYCGTYTVTELTGWSWTYECTDGSTKTAELTVEDSDAKVLTFTNQYQIPDWLTDETGKENQFS